MENCIFCKIANGEIPSRKAYEDESVLAFYDLDPQAPTHILIIPKEHIPSVAGINEQNCDAVSKVFCAIAKVAKELGLEENGYRVVSNCGEAAGQTVHHLHFHILGGRTLELNMG